MDDADEELGVHHRIRSNDAPMRVIPNEHCNARCLLPMAYTLIQYDLLPSTVRHTCLLGVR